MTSVLNIISKLRDDDRINIDYQNSNRYRLVVQEDDGTKTAYYFSAPIYDCKTGKIIDMKFRMAGGQAYLNGSNADIFIGETIHMKNSEGECFLNLDTGNCIFAENKLRCGETELFPTTNGVAVKAKTGNDKPFIFDIEAGEPFLQTRSNNKYFALMKGEFKPFFSVSAIGVLDKSGSVVAPAEISYQKLSDSKYQISVSSFSPGGEAVLFETNLYEPKLYQDTTVESNNPKMNNSFGGTAFIGNTEAFGEQWLYSRLDHSKLPELMDKHIYKAVMYLPKFNKTAVDLSAVKVSARFCSFGSNWNNKLGESGALAETIEYKDHLALDITAIAVNKIIKNLTASNGFILRSRVKGGGFSAIATGDSYYAPEILEINYR